MKVRKDHACLTASHTATDQQSQVISMGSPAKDHRIYLSARESGSRSLWRLRHGRVRTRSPRQLLNMTGWFRCRGLRTGIR
ncbi:hypothetical protein HY634_01550 [Candidatus Uhrbacteria bacterium]|nr:hypothetical protein [Candidatus Uhrbacteria bacterium]